MTNNLLVLQFSSASLIWFLVQCGRIKGRRAQLFAKKSIFKSEDETMQNEDPDEPMASGPSSDDEVSI